MVVSANRLASEAGAEMLRAGGNAVDAAVAMGYALAVVDPCCGNIGGGGFMTLHLADGRDVFVNFREQAPAAATPDMYLDAEGNVAAGRQPVRLARGRACPARCWAWTRRCANTARCRARASWRRRSGWRATGSCVGARRRRTDRAARRSSARAIRRRRAIFLHPDGAPLAAGDRLVQPALARHAGRHRRARAGRILSRRHSRGGRGGRAAPPAASSPRPISPHYTRHRVAAAALHLSRLAVPVAPHRRRRAASRCAKSSASSTATTCTRWASIRRRPCT